MSRAPRPRSWGRSKRHPAGRARYVATAEAIDRARSQEVRAQSAALDDFTKDYARRPGATITAFGYHADRVGQPRP